jgi:dTDP-4-amino-4,6-dideoxygalactose transaminase
MSEKLAILGGTPVRNMQIKPWSPWPLTSIKEWESEIEPRFREVYLSGAEGLGGKKSEELDERYAKYSGTNYAVFMPHGTDAISAALAGVLDLDGFGDGGEVIIPNYTFVATASAALDRKCTVAFVDIDPDNFTLAPAAVEATIRPGRTRAILPVHLGGHPANMDALRLIAEKHGLAMIEDCAQAHGAEYRGKKVGSLGDAGAFSFQSSKNLTSGEGGMVTTDDKDVRDRVYAFMNVGRAPGGARWEYPRLGWNYRPSEYLAALLIARLEKLEAQIDVRNANAAYLSKELKQIDGITPPKLSPWVTKHGYHLYCAKYNPEGFGGKPRSEFLNVLRAEGVPCSSGYGSPLSREAGMAHLARKYPHLIRELPCPVTEQVCKESVWLFQNLLLSSREDMDDIVEAIAKIQRAWR